ncbi:glycosyltransferase [Maridesulfovibrio hydrothermalis]|uniref:Glycosyl transferase family 2 n=1 Tax=Maridesulfovibrio hydrothermalis AM13 = DSM 14728 TaxID=1121451 RepID=L0R7F5_9BACT|nr:glycosyltransferase [Maridesulfovibrio hydrothermalis]CCO22669.1 Glycosyl transferase family 2 [Maridesulfovibrio hydrothermalis AM13 = DSM 14728]
MESGFPENYWSDMSGLVRRRLLLGSVGAKHLFDTGVRSLESDPQLAAELLLASYAASPLDGSTAQQLVHIEGLLSLFSDSVSECLTAVLKHWHRPDNLSYFLRITSKRDNDKIRSYIASCLEKEPGNLFWVQQGLIHAGACSDFEFGLKILSGDFPESAGAAVNSSRAFFHYMNGDTANAFKMLLSASEVLGIASFAHLSASIALKSGERETAIKILSASVGAQPWRSSEALRLYDLVCGLDGKMHPLPGKLAILLYSFNKAEELDATLSSLHRSELHGAKIFMLDNGSGDDTAGVISRWQAEFGEQMVRIDLPVNVGAAAARNWLMNEQEVKECEFALYLDDDVEVQPDWLSRLGAAVAEYPDAGVWGCKVVDHLSPSVMQSVDLHIVQPVGDEGDGPEVDLTRIAPNPFKVSGLHHQLLDAGYFDFMRPCASVTGCCHLFRTAKLLDNGGFSLFLSPSQYDDMEHDLRSCLKGEFGIYQGHLRILHRKNTGAASRVSVVQEGNALGNKYKMQAMHPRSEILKIMAAEERLLQHDLEKKMQYLDEKGFFTG